MGSCFVRVPCYIGDLKRDPNLENYPYRAVLGFIGLMGLIGFSVDKGLG